VARRAFTVPQLVEILERWQRGEGLRAIAGRLQISRNTVREYVRSAQAAGLRQDAAMGAEELAAFVREHFPAAQGPGARSLWRQELDGRRQEIEQGLATNRVGTVWGRLHRAGKVKASLSTFRRYVRREIPAPVEAKDVVVHGPEAAPGELAEVDFGRLGLWRDPRDGRRHMLWAFIMVLAYSRHMFVRPVLRMDKRVWLECHLLAWAFLGGVVVRVVLDNLKSGVLKPDIYDPQLNRAYAEMARHYGVVLDPARSLHPKDKPHVERMVPYVREHLFRGREQHFADLQAGADFAEQWCRDEAGMRIHAVTKRRPYEAFLADELAALGPLPEVAWEPYTWEQAHVGPDCYCTVAGARYTVPWRLLHQQLDARVADLRVEFFHRQELVKVWARAPRGGRQTDPSDFPPDRIAYFQRTPQWCLQQAAAMGEGVHEALRELLSVHTSAHLRQAQAILRLADTYGPERLQAACLRACDYGDPRYGTIKTILASGLDRLPSQMRLREPVRTSATGAYLRGPAAYATAGHTAAATPKPPSGPAVTSDVNAVAADVPLTGGGI
jgi:transposase